MHPLGDEARAGGSRRPGLVPGDLAVDVLVVALLARDRIAAAAERLGAAEDDLVAHRAAVVVDRPRHRVHGDLRPDAAGRVRLAEGEAGAAAGIAQCLQAVRPHRLRRPRQRRASASSPLDAQATRTAARPSDEETSKWCTASEIHFGSKR